MSRNFDTEQLPFSPDKQQAVLGYTLDNTEFFNSVITKIDPDWFSEELTRRTFAVAKKMYMSNPQKPTFREIEEHQDIITLDPKLKTRIKSNIAICKSNTALYSAQNLLNEMQGWMKSRIIALALPKASMAFNAHNVEESYNILARTIKDYNEANFHGDGAESFKNYALELKQEEIDRGRAMTFGLEDMDRHIDPNGKTGFGSLFRGDMTVLLAPTNVGKTSAMVTIASHNLNRGKSVLFLTHEGGRKEIKNKIMRCMMHKSKPELLRLYLDAEPAMLAKLERLENALDRDLTYVPLNKPGLTVEEVATVIDKFQAKRILQYGKGYDLLVDDYPAKLNTQLASGGQFQRRHIDEEVYNQFVQIGLKYDIHVLVAIQTNREGSRVNRHTGNYKNERRLLQMEDVLESWGPMTAAATVISMNRDDIDARNGKLTYFLCKSRSGETGWAVTVNTDYDRCLIHSNEQGCFSYRGSDNLSEVSSSLMQAYRGQVVPSEKIKFFKQMGT